jgi:hypothetical protein
LARDVYAVYGEDRMSFIDILEAEVNRIESDIPTDEELKNISELANRQVYLESLVTRLNQALQKVNEHLTSVSERYLPDAMASAGLSAFTLEDGRKINIKKIYLPSVTEENKEAAYQWMVDNGHDIIKNEVIVSFPKGHSSEASEAIHVLKVNGFDPTQKESIHWQTFRAWAKEVMEKGEQIPDTIKIHVVNKSTVKSEKLSNNY